MRDKYIFFLPFSYFLSTRCRSVFHKISWILIYPVPILLFGYIAGIFQETKEIILLLTGFLLIYNNYEIGYIENDTETIKKEAAPTLRLSKKKVKYYQRRRKEIYAFRFLLSVVISLFIFWSSLHEFVQNEVAVRFIILAWLINVLYLFYNRHRSIINLSLHFILVTLRFCSPFYLMTSSWLSFFLSLLLFPVINTSERMRGQRFNITWASNLWVNDSKNGRYWYYAIVTVIYLVASMLFPETGSTLRFFAVVAAYLFTYRLITAIGSEKYV